MRAWSRLTQRRPRGQFRVGLGPRQVGWEMEGAPPSLSTESSTEEVAAWTRAQTIDGAAEVAEKFLAEEVDGEVLAACETDPIFIDVASPLLLPAASLSLTAGRAHRCRVGVVRSAQG
jgi:hypothetical protein